jgi:hypothetical protein
MATVFAALQAIQRNSRNATSPQAAFGLRARFFSVTRPEALRPPLPNNNRYDDAAAPGGDGTAAVRVGSLD